MQVKQDESAEILRLQVKKKLEISSVLTEVNRESRFSTSRDGVKSIQKTIGEKLKY